MLAFAIQLTVVIAVLGALGALLVLGARKATAGMIELDAGFRPLEEQTGVCGACEGAGTTIQALTSGSVQMVTCYRCGGDGRPPPPGVVDPAEGSWPLDSNINRLRQGAELYRATRSRPKPGR